MRLKLLQTDGVKQNKIIPGFIIYLFLVNPTYWTFHDNLSWSDPFNRFLRAFNKLDESDVKLCNQIVFFQ